MAIGGGRERKIMRVWFLWVEYMERRGEGGGWWWRRLRRWIVCCLISCCVLVL